MLETFITMSSEQEYIAHWSMIDSHTFHPSSQTQANLCEFKANLVYVKISSHPELHGETLSQNREIIKIN